MQDERKAESGPPQDPAVWRPLVEAAREMGLPYMTAWKYAADGRLLTRRDGRRWFVLVP
jgi:hypothetical protein